MNKSYRPLTGIFMLLTIIIFPSYITAQKAVDPLQYIDLKIGTTAAGNVYPGVCRPFGLVKWTPQTRAGEEKGSKPYDYKDTKIQGIRWTNFISGSAVPEYGSATIMAITGDLKTDPAERASTFSHDSEHTTPYSYKVELEDYDITMECTSTERAGYFRFTFPQSENGYILVQPNNTPRAKHTQDGIAYLKVVPERNEIIGYNPAFRYYISTGQTAGFSGYFVARFKNPFTEFGVWDGTGIVQGSTEAKGQPGAYVKFSSEPGEIIEVKVGCSFTGFDGARKNLDAEIPGWNFESVKQETQKIWCDHLGNIEIVSSDEEVKTNFYTALYHALLLPHIFGDVDGAYPGFAGTSIQKGNGFVYYDDYSMWDTYRAQHPLLLLIEPDKIGDMITSLLVKADQGGWLPIFPAWNSYTTEMIGDHCISMITDAYAKGFRDFDTEKAYRYMRKNATGMPEDYNEYADGKGRRAVDDYFKYGYVPLDNPVEEAFHKAEQVSRTLEYAYDDFCLAEFASALGKTSDYKMFRSSASNYKNVFDTSVGFVRGRYKDGSWDTPFDPGGHHKYITEATPWVYTWYVPHDVQGLINLMGGRKQFSARLDEFFDKDFYRHDNEPSHQITYLYCYAGEPWKTQERIRQAMKANYNTGPAGLSGNDDAGQMSAWYIFSAMGFYPVCPGTTQYILGSPVVEKAVIRLDGPYYKGKTFTVEARNVSGTNKYIQAIYVNGREWDKPWFDHSVIVEGGKIVFEMGPDPNKTWGSSEENVPYSMTAVKTGQ